MIDYTKVNHTMMQPDDFYIDKLNGCYCNYSGSKWRYIQELHALMPDNYDIKALDLFCGGAGVVSHMPIDWNITANDAESRTIAIHKMVVDNPAGVLNNLTKLMEVFKLDNKNAEGFNQLKQFYNITKDNNLALYLLICHSFSNYIRFNGVGEFNVQFGKRTFNKNMREKLYRFADRCSKRNINFTSKDFREFDFNDYDFIFADPPYMETTATYNEGGGWGVKEEMDLLYKLKNTRSLWMLTNQTISKGKKNQLLLDFIEQGNYNVTILKDTTENCNYQRKGGETIEVIVTNY